MTRVRAAQEPVHTLLPCPNPVWANASANSVCQLFGDADSKKLEGLVTKRSLRTRKNSYRAAETRVVARLPGSRLSNLMPSPSMTNAPLSHHLHSPVSKLGDFLPTISKLSKRSCTSK